MHNRHMTTPTFRLADSTADHAALLDINLEYVGWVFAEIEKMSGMTAREILGAEVADYVPTVIDKVCGDPPPRGAFYLVEHAGRVVAKAQIAQNLADLGEEISDNLIEVYVSRLRPKAEAAGLAIRTVRGFGYLLEVAAEGSTVA